ncbi:sugar phosphate nucleotidyltransferase [Pontimonas sp.]|nr:sugar phosphate nucleotidyltransferase [Pontimonas sp.]
MKVVLLAGGLGTRMREETEFRPKPMVEIGGKPAIWHLMKLYANYGHREFIICAGYKGEQIKNYFYNYRPLNLDFSIDLGKPDSISFFGLHDEFDWNVTIIDTGLETPTGGRVKAVENYVHGETFMCSYGDSIAPVNLDGLLAAHKRSSKIGTVTTTKPRSRFGVVQVDGSGKVLGFEEKPMSQDLVSIGHFIFEPEVFNYLSPDCVLELEPLRQLADEGQLGSYEHEGFWQPMDTAHEFYSLNALYETQSGPWA